MLIGCLFKRPKAPVELPGKTYFFTPIDPANPDSEHVADVTDTAHIQRLLQIPEAYYISDAQQLQTTARPTPAGTEKPNTAASTTAAPKDPPVDNGNSGGASTSSAPQDPPADQTTAPPPADNTVQKLPAELEEHAQNLNALSWQALKAQLAKGGIDKAVIQRAYDIELEKPEDDQRGTTVKVLKAELGIQ